MEATVIYDLTCPHHLLSVTQTNLGTIGGATAQECEPEDGDHWGLPWTLLTTERVSKNGILAWLLILTQ